MDRLLQTLTPFQCLSQSACDAVLVGIEHTILESLHEIRDGNKFVWAAAARKIRYSAVLLGASDGLLNAFWRNSKLARNCFHSNAALKLSNYFQKGLLSDARTGFPRERRQLLLLELRVSDSGRHSWIHVDFRITKPEKVKLNFIFLLSGNIPTDSLKYSKSGC